MKTIAVSLFVVAASTAYAWDRPPIGSTEDPRGSVPANGGSQTSNADTRPRPVVAETKGIPSANLYVTQQPNEPRRLDASIALAAFVTSDSKPVLRVQPVWTTTSALQPSPPNTLGPAWADAGLKTALAAQPAGDLRILQLRPTPLVTLVQLTPPVPPAAPTPPPSPPSAAPPNPAAPQFKDGTYTGSPANAYYGTVQVRVVVKSGQVASIVVLNYPSDRSTSRQINNYALPQLQREVVQAFQSQSARIRIISGATLTTEAYLNSVQSALKQALVTPAPPTNST